MNIHIIKVTKDQMRYDTAGDWYYDEAGDLVIKVATDFPEFPTNDHHNLVALHELIEVLLCRKRGITQQMVDDFDMGPGSYDVIPEDEESGDQPGCPYGKEHRFAMIVEHMMAHELGLTGYGVMR
jgi:hypothetical protein